MYRAHSRRVHSCLSIIYRCTAQGEKLFYTHRIYYSILFIFILGVYVVVYFLYVDALLKGAAVLNTSYTEFYIMHILRVHTIAYLCERMHRSTGKLFYSHHTYSTYISIYIYIHIYTHVYIHFYLCICMYRYMCVYIYTHSTYLIYHLFYQNI